MRYLLGARVLAGSSLAPIPGGAVAVDGPRIDWVGTAAQARDRAAPADSIEDLGDVTILPGLIDSHVHLGFDGGPDPVARMKRETDAQQLVLMLRSARELLSAGVTTARDLGARSFLDIAVRDAIAAGDARGPRMVVANRPITLTGGHCWFMGAECDDETAVRTMVRLHHKMGADCIKVMSTGGFMTAGSAPWHAQFTERELRAAVDEAHRLGKRVAAHGHGLEGIRRAVAAGVDTIEHCSFAIEGAVGEAAFDPAAADAIAEAGIAVCPTINVNTLRNRETTGRRFASRLMSLIEHGVTIIAGADAGITNAAHRNYVGGLEAMSHFGMSAPEVLRAATVRAAEALGVDQATGTLEAGKDADLLAVAGDPAASISALHDTRLIMARGVDYQPEFAGERVLGAGAGG
ncbi:MAG: amidohydrolase family protein [Frankiaceae bacterium]|jgi:imidazolonepropionase-like amidohydrolase|nr:amidohydrolase family protein [Frankiaceae bacterium]